MGEKWLSLGMWWWFPWKGAREAVAQKEIVWWELVIVFGIELLAMSGAALLSMGGRFSSFFHVLGVLVGFSVGTVLFWGVVGGGMMLLLTGLFRRVVVFERLFFLFVVSHLPWVMVFPFFLVSWWLAGITEFLTMVVSLLSFFWLWETLRLEYALSRREILLVIVLPFVGVVLFWILSLFRMVILLGFQGWV